MDLFCIKLKQFPIKKDVQSSLFCTAMLQFSVQEFLQQISEGKKIRFLGSPYSLSKLFQFNTAWLFAPRPYIPLRQLVYANDFLQGVSVQVTNTVCKQYILISLGKKRVFCFQKIAGGVRKEVGGGGGLTTHNNNHKTWGK